MHAVDKKGWLSESDYQELRHELFVKFGLTDTKYQKKAEHALFLAIKWNSRIWDIEETFKELIPLFKEEEWESIQ
ncbi:hypothetical protein PP175_25820 (plasmid) [Aneurinibacillus sp. Ricciae_BoGa-3]|uniref:hypothetical protein n=1 Tax=Aneurinibacillus sp. Ricciae_BoGa-3 TaxID=3022697 RepID=UPI00233FB85A|nr:hypothetical protein [Aneurinibacillus sp. Ricciae_BoGa-3]WCK57487.1 hypothetical protein PP175_25820 [Aneurinibacillus sp. Ricciae_BoGa-3]